MKKKSLVIPSVPLQLRMKDASGEHVLRFRLVYDSEAFTRIEEKLWFRMPCLLLVVLGVSEKSYVSATDMLAILFWAGIVRHSPEYGDENGLAAIRSYLNLRNVGPITKAIREAFLRCLPEDQQGELRGFEV